MAQRRPRHLAALGALVLLAACGGRAASGDTGPTTTPVALPEVAEASTLAAAAQERAEVLCDTRSADADGEADVARRYVQETWSGVAELVGRAPLPAPGDASARRQAREAVLAGWADRPELADRRWDRIGQGEVACADDRLYLVVALGRLPVPADAGALAVDRFGPSEVQVREGVTYGRAVDISGVEVPLVLDVYLPPKQAEARPALVLVHGGGFAAGSRAMHADDALAYARRGFVAVTIDYRLDPDAGESVEAHRAASQMAIDDGMEAVRWVRANADQLGVDPDRIAALGASAGGEIALGLALLEDRSPTGPLAAVSPRVAAAVSTGAYLTPVLGGARLDADDAPILLHYFETDTASGRPWTYAAATCQAVRAAGTTCDLDVTPGAAHTIGLGPGSTEADRITAFLSVHLDLGS